MFYKSVLTFSDNPSLVIKMNHLIWKEKPYSFIIPCICEVFLFENVLISLRILRKCRLEYMNLCNTRNRLTWAKKHNEKFISAFFVNVKHRFNHLIVKWMQENWMNEYSAVTLVPANSKILENLPLSYNLFLNGNLNYLD